MAKKSKRRTWTAADVRTLKTSAKKKTQASSIARSLKRTEGLLGKRPSALGCPLIHEPDASLFGPQDLSPAEVRGFHFANAQHSQAEGRAVGPS